MSAPTYSRTAPDTLWYNAREEILFGSGAFTISVVDPAIASRIAKRWTTHFLSHPQGLAFNVEQNEGKVIITLSEFGETVVQSLGETKESLEFKGMRTGEKALFLSAFETAIKEIL